MKSPCANQFRRLCNLYDIPIYNGNIFPFLEFKIIDRGDKGVTLPKKIKPTLMSMKLLWYTISETMLMIRMI